MNEIKVDLILAGSLIVASIVTKAAIVKYCEKKHEEILDRKIKELENKFLK